MRRVKSRDTWPELLLRGALERIGVSGWTTDDPVGSYRPDLCFRTERVAVFVDGCFWHSCPRHGVVPKTRSAWWAAKLGRTRERDVRREAWFVVDGWDYVRLWEHEVVANPDGAALKVWQRVLLRRPQASRVA